ncbi:MAG TPA: hypothetical protein VE326_11285 [Candidatus Binatia bacterium]|nr:hypothetical protein [Candidatus Binatia bacterium]
MTSARPWQGETRTLPERLDGQRVVAHIKLPTRPIHLTHQWIAVTEVSNSTVFFDLVAVAYQEQARPPLVLNGQGRNLSYREAVEKMYGYAMRAFVRAGIGPG